VCLGSCALLRDICPLCDGVIGWPRDISSVVEMNLQPHLRHTGLFREIRAIHNSKTVRVYQAYNAAIADAAVAANSFKAPLEAGIWSPSRRSWIKPSAVWMAYRCGWSVMKDENQCRVLALDVSRSGLERVLMGAIIADDSEPGQCKDCPVVVQWDPERFIRPCAKHGKESLTTDVRHIRSIQIGLKDSSDTFLNEEFLLKIVDVTETFRAAHKALTATPPDVEAACALLWPNEQEEHMSVPPDLRHVLHMSPGDYKAHSR